MPQSAKRKPSRRKSKDAAASSALYSDFGIAERGQHGPMVVEAVPAEAKDTRNRDRVRAIEIDGPLYVYRRNRVISVLQRSCARFGTVARRRPDLARDLEPYRPRAPHRRVLPGNGHLRQRRGRPRRLRRTPPPLRRSLARRGADWVGHRGRRRLPAGFHPARSLRNIAAGVGYLGEAVRVGLMFDLDSLSCFAKPNLVHV